jgi:hypothetical protein
MAPGVDKLKRMKARLKGTAAEELPAPYSINCECGTEIEGTRNATSKQTCCPDCLTELFLLPTNVYPSTASVPSDVISGGLAQRLLVVLKELLPGRSQSTETVPATKKPSQKKSQGSSAESSDVETSPSKPRLTLPRFNPVRTIRRVLTPLRLLIAGMVLAIVALRKLGQLGVMPQTRFRNSCRNENSTDWNRSLSMPSKPDAFWDRLGQNGVTRQTCWKKLGRFHRSRSQRFRSRCQRLVSAHRSHRKT